ncbi:hypothetical protein MPS38_003041 [Salmonella enterica]|nr:hypothetical protein [Salmonella enterica]EIZ5832145.1 hypothetical protein [Salmonella enterica]
MIDYELSHKEKVTKFNKLQAVELEKMQNLKDFQIERATMEKEISEFLGDGDKLEQIHKALKILNLLEKDYKITISENYGLILTRHPKNVTIQ